MSQWMANALAHRGARRLDKVLGGIEWAIEFDLDSFDMENGCRCVAGQIAGNRVNLDRLGWHHGDTPGYSEAVELIASCRIKEVRTQEVMLGFNTPGPDVPVTKRLSYRGKFIDVTYEELQRAWESEIIERKLAAKHADA